MINSQNQKKDETCTILSNRILESIQAQSIFTTWELTSFLEQ